MAETKHSKESEKSLEQYLTDRAKGLGCKSLKYYNPVSTGWPDRIVLFPAGFVVWVELKSKGETLRPLQAQRHVSLRDMGHAVYTCDSREKIDAMFKKELTRILEISKRAILRRQDNGPQA